MDTSAVTALWYLPLVIPICIWVAWSDLSTMKIPNKAVLALVAVFVVLGLFLFPLVDLGWRLVHLVVVLAITFVLSIVRVLGAGDAKFIAAMAPFIAIRDVTLIAMVFAICVVLGFLSHRVARSIPAIRNLAPNWESWERTRDFPMGFPLAATLVAYLALIAAGY